MMNKNFMWIPLVVLAVLTFSLAVGCKPAPATAAPMPSQVPAGDPVYWRPGVGERLQIQYAGYPPDTAIDADIFALDLFEIPQAVIDQLHADGKKVICYLNTGSWEEYRPDAGDFPADTIGKDYEGWPGEKWLDIRNYEKFADIMEARFDLAKSKGCDGIDADNMQNYQEETGFPISTKDQLTYNLWLSEQAHRRGMSIGLKNDPEQVEDLLEHYDWSLIEDCSVYDWCKLLQPFVQAGKPVFQVEYTDTYTSTDEFCVGSGRSGFSGFLKNRELDVWVEFCP